MKITIETPLKPSGGNRFGVVGKRLGLGVVAIAAISVYRRARKAYLAGRATPVEHLVEAAEGVGPYGRSVYDGDEVDEEQMEPDEVAKWHNEQELTDWFNPFLPLTSSSRAHRNLIRYWCDRLRMEVKIIGNSPADRSVLRYMLTRMMKAKSYRTHQIAAMVDTVVGLTINGARIHEYSHCIPRKQDEYTFWDWFFRAPRRTGAGRP